MLKTIWCTLLALSFSGSSLAFPYIVRVKNLQKQPLMIQENKKTLFEIPAGKSSEFVIMAKSNLRVRYLPGNEIANLFRWAHDEPVNNLAEQCRINVMDHTDDDLLICAFSFEKKTRSKLGSHSYTLDFDYVVNTKLKTPDFVQALNDFVGSSNIFFSRVDKDVLAINASKRNDLKVQLEQSHALPGLSRALEVFDKGLKKISRQDDEHQNFLVFGDQGSGDDKARRVARDMYAVCSLKGCHDALVVGDNIYPMAPSINDAKWESQFVQKFTKIYQRLWDEWKFPFYTTLGNHDIGVDALINTDWVYFEKERGDRSKDFYLKNRVKRMQAQVAFTQNSENPSEKDVRMWNMPASYYAKTLTENKIKTFIASIDSNYFPAEVGENGESPKSEAQSNIQSKWLKQQLASDDATRAHWRIVFGHHAMFSIGRHGVNGSKHGVRADDASDMIKLRDALLPILCKGKVDFYLAGHDHHMQIDEITCPEGSANPGHKIVQILSGAAAKMETENPWGDKLLGDDKAFTKAALYPQLRWANGLLPSDIQSGTKARRLLGFAYLSLSHVEAGIEMIESTTEGPKTLKCFNFDKKALDASNCKDNEKVDSLFVRSEDVQILPRPSWEGSSR